MFEILLVVAGLAIAHKAFKKTKDFDVGPVPHPRLDASGDIAAGGNRLTGHLVYASDGYAANYWKAHEWKANDSWRGNANTLQ